MGLMDLVNVNYKQIFNTLMQSPEAQCMMADFLNHCLLHCEETRECIIDILSKDESFNKVIDDSIERVIKKSKMKSDYFYE
jgi:hypothetical protein